MTNRVHAAPDEEYQFMWLKDIDQKKLSKKYEKHANPWFFCNKCQDIKIFICVDYFCTTGTICCCLFCPYIGWANCIAKYFKSQKLRCQSCHKVLEKKIRPSDYKTMNPERQLEIAKKICELAKGIVWKNNCNPLRLEKALNLAIQGHDGGAEFTIGLLKKVADSENFRGISTINGSTMYCEVTNNWITLSVIFAQLYNRDNCKHRVQIDSEIVGNPQQNNAET